jgi:hypothetical protein
MVQVLSYEKGGNLIMRYIVKSLAGQILHFKAFPRISPIVVIRLCEIYGTANLLIVARNIPEQVDGFSGIGKNERYLDEISDFIRFSALKLSNRLMKAKYPCCFG